MLSTINTAKSPAKAVYHPEITELQPWPGVCKAGRTENYAWEIVFMAVNARTKGNTELSNMLLRFPALLAGVLVSASVWTACAPDQSSETDDIFVEDRGDSARGNSRRHPADNEQKLWTITMSGCTGHLISPDYMMSAAHCSPKPGARYKSGYAIGRGQSSDITVTQVVETGADLDYAIMKISWANGYPKDQKFPPSIATKESDVTFGTAESAGDELFTVGFPQDKFGSWGATYAEGRAKIARGGRLYYNIGIINGNSGGGVWRKSDKMLVSLTNGGAHAFGQSGWDTANASSSANWNFGPTIWTVYARSEILKDIFPGGRNRFTGTTDEPVSKDISVLIGEADQSAADAHTLYFSIPDTGSTLAFCMTATTANCDENASGYTTTTLVRTAGGRKFFKARSATALNSGLHISVVAKDNAAKQVAAATVRFNAR
jgi:V8-like Glu-specific endopeptidase